jgi:hypothetical protein
MQGVRICGLLWTRWWTFQFHKRRLIYWLLASREGFCSMDLISLFVSQLISVLVLISSCHMNTVTWLVQQALKQNVLRFVLFKFTCEGVAKSFRNGLLEQELQLVQLSATRGSCIAILWVSLVSFAAITLCVASQRVFVVLYFVIDSVRKHLDTLS